MNAGVPSPAGGDTAVWRVPSQASALQWRQWDDEIAVRVAATGGTHLLSPAATGVMGVLRGHPSGMTAAELADALLGGAERDDVDRLLELLDGLQQLGVLHRSTA